MVFEAEHQNIALRFGNSMTSCHFRHVLPFVFATCHVFYPGLTPHPTIINVFFFVEVADFDVTVSNNLGSKEEEDLDDAEVDDKSATWSGLLMFLLGDSQER